MPKTLDEIAEWLRMELRRGDYVLEGGARTFDIHISIALTEAYDLGRAERDKEWREPAEALVNTVQAIEDAVAEERKALQPIIDAARLLLGNAAFQVLSERGYKGRRMDLEIAIRGFDAREKESR